jgi:hypothetical protein
MDKNEPEELKNEPETDAEEQEEEACGNQRDNLLMQGVYEWLSSLVFVLVPLVLIFTTAARVMGVDGISMEPTLYDKD